MIDSTAFHPPANSHAGGHPQKRRAVLMGDDVPWHQGDIFKYVYGVEHLEELAQETDLYPTRITQRNWKDHIYALAEAEIIFSCWGLWEFTSEELDAMPSLQVIFHAGGAIDFIAQPCLDRGITFFGTADANALPVAEFCLAQILLSTKGYLVNSARCRMGPWQQNAMPVGPGNYGEKVALLGIGAVCQHLLRLLQPFDLEVLAVSDYLDASSARELGISRLVDFETAFREALVISNHLPDTPDLRGIFNRRHFASMRTGATFINTGRGAQVNENDLVEVLRERPDLTALLDVQHPEPPPAHNPLYSLPNVHLTSHIAGSANDEVRRLADAVIDVFRSSRWGNARQTLQTHELSA